MASFLGQCSHKLTSVYCGLWIEGIAYHAVLGVLVDITAFL